MIRIKSSARTAVAIGAAGVAVLGFAPTASAASSDTLNLVVNHTSYASYTYASNGSPDIEGLAQPVCVGSVPSKVTLTVTPQSPGVVPQDETIATATPKDCTTPVSISPLATTVNTAGPHWSNGVPAMNGVYTVDLNNGGQVTAHAAFTLLIPPAKTAGFKVTPSGTKATFGWIANAEPDIVGYVIKDSTGKVIAQSTDGCTGTTCSDGPINLGSSVAGQNEKFSITAVRACGGVCGSGDLIHGKSPAISSAQFAAATSPTPTPTPTKTTGGGGSKGSGDGSLNDGGTKTGTSGKGKTGTLSDPGGNSAKHHHKKGLGGGLGAFGGASLPSLNVPALPDGISAANAGTTEPSTLGKPGGNLAYPAPEVATKKKVTAESGGGSITHEISVAVNKKPLWRGIAAAAVLLLIAVHLRAWAGRTESL